jgi:hypothetical protein
MAGDENKRSGTEPDSGAEGSEAPVSGSEGTAAHSPPPEPTSESEAETPLSAELPTAAEPGLAAEPDAIEERTAAEEDSGGAASSIPEEGPETAPVPSLSVPAASDASPRAAPRARTPLLPRLVPYLVVFAIGALISIGAAFILNLLAGGRPEIRGDLEERLASLDARTAAVERRQERDSTSLGTLAERFGTAETHVRQAVSAVREVEKALAALPSAVAPAAGGSAPEPADLGPLVARLEALEQKLEQGSGAPAAGEAEPSGAAVDFARAQAAAIVAGRLVKEIERGDPYSHELDALASLGIDQAALVPLETFSKTGVTSPRRLSEEFARLAPSILAAERKSGDDNLVERLKGYASNLVQIERTDDPAAKDIPSLVARIKLALAHDHVAEAYSLWSELPEAARTVSESFGTAAKNRLDALDAARSFEAGAVAALGKPKS